MKVGIHHKFVDIRHVFANFVNSFLLPSRYILSKAERHESDEG